MLFLMSENLFKKLQSDFYYNKEKIEVTFKTNCKLYLKVNTILVSLGKTKLETPYFISDKLISPPPPNNSGENTYILQLREDSH